MAFLTLAAQGASLATGVMGSIYEGRIAAQQAQVQAENTARIAEAKAEADEFNAKVAEQLAGVEKDRATAGASDFRRAQMARLASSRAKQAASGFSLEGSPLLVDESIFSEIELGAARLGHAGDVAATRLRNESTLLRRSAVHGRDTAIFAREAGAQSASNITSASLLRAAGAGAKGLSNIGLTLAGQGVTFG